MIPSNPPARLRVSAVSYMNTSPLVWGMLHGPQRDVFDLRFELPSACAESLERGTADLGLVPVIEVERQGLSSVPGLGIASDGPVRSILLISKVPAEQISTVAMDNSSRTSVALTRIVLAERYGAYPAERSQQPSVEGMLAQADAALIIGDPALHYDVSASPHYTYDLGAEWKALTGLPMVYAMWAGRFPAGVGDVLQGSYEFGRDRLNDIVEQEAAARGFGVDLVGQYLTHTIQHELNALHAEGMRRFLDLAGKHLPHKKT